MTTFSVILTQLYGILWNYTFGEKFRNFMELYNGYHGTEQLDADIIFLPCGFFFFLSSFFFFPSPYVSRRTLDVYHTSTHGVALVRI